MLTGAQEEPGGNPLLESGSFFLGRGAVRAVFAVLFTSTYRVETYTYLSALSSKLCNSSMLKTVGAQDALNFAQAASIRTYTRYVSTGSRKRDYRAAQSQQARKLLYRYISICFCVPSLTYGRREMRRDFFRQSSLIRYARKCKLNCVIPVTMGTRCFHKKLKYPPKDFCTARYERNSSKKSFKLFKTPQKNNSWADLGPRSA